MATTSALKTKLDTEAANNGSGGQWTTSEAAVEVIKTAIEALETLTPPTGASATQVQGTAADGVAVVGNPVLSGGSDGTNAQTFLTDTTGRQVVVGGAATGAAVSGNPVLVAGSDGTNARSVKTDTSGRVSIVWGESGTLGAGVSNGPLLLYSDGSALARVLATNNYLYNGASADAQRNNTNVSLLTSAARTTTQTSADQTNHNARAIHIIWDITVHGGGAGATLSIQSKDAIGIYYTLLTGVAETTTGTKVYKLGPGITTAANAAAADFLPRTFRVVITAGDATSITYSLAYNLIN